VVIFLIAFVFFFLGKLHARAREDIQPLPT